MCCFSQLSLLSSSWLWRSVIDPFSLFQREVSLKVLGHLDAMSLGRAAQVSRSWKQLADDDLLWRNMCEQHIERKCEKCGWGLPLLSERRRRVPGPAVQLGTPSRAISALMVPAPAPRVPRLPPSARSNVPLRLPPMPLRSRSSHARVLQADSFKCQSQPLALRLGSSRIAAPAYF